MIEKPYRRSIASFIVGVVLAIGCAPSILFAQAAKGYHAISYSATLRLDRLQDSLYGHVEMIGRADSNIASILQHSKFLTIDSIFVDGAKASFANSDTVSGSYYVQANPITTGSQFHIVT